MGNKYKGLSGKSPREAAAIVGNVEKRNYLAHTIREIELAILRTQRKHYHIITYASETNPKSWILFREEACEIRLTSACEETDDREIRFILAHELGHLVYNIDKLKDPALFESTKRSTEQEMYAWQFAYYLIDRKSVEHQDNMQRGRFVYSTGELRRSLTSILTKLNPEICDDVIKSLFASKA